MANAVSRARRRDGAAADGPSGENEETGERRLVARTTASGRAGVQRVSRRRRRIGRGAADRAPALLVSASIGVFVLVLAGLALGLALRSQAPSPTNGAGTGPSGGPAARSTGPPEETSRQPTTAPGPDQPGSPSGPRLDAVSPALGHAGQSVVVQGSGFFSRNGDIVAYLGAAAAPTSCRTRTSCTVTVPELGGHKKAEELTVRTQSGRSNALAFSYL
ncbi:MAG: IPT/TIG domain-containing protein [Acidimicrobiales bacterium]